MRFYIAMILLVACGPLRADDLVFFPDDQELAREFGVGEPPLPPKRPKHVAKVHAPVPATVLKNVTPTKRAKKEIPKKAPPQVSAKATPPLPPTPPAPRAAPAKVATPAARPAPPTPKVWRTKYQCPNATDRLDEISAMLEHSLGYTGPVTQMMVGDTGGSFRVSSTPDGIIQILVNTQAGSVTGAASVCESSPGVLAADFAYPPAFSLEALSGKRPPMNHAQMEFRAPANNAASQIEIKSEHLTGTFHPQATQ